MDISERALGLAFSMFVVGQAGTQFPTAWWRDRHGPTGITVLATVLAEGAYVGLSYTTAAWHIHTLYFVGTVRVGVVYTVAVNTASCGSRIGAG